MKERLIEITKKLKDLVSKLFRLLVLPLMIMSRKIYLPGFRGVALYDVGLFFIRGMQKSSISLRANSISYSFIIAFVPAVLFLFTLIPYFHIAGLEDNLMMTLQEILPNEAYLLIRSTIEDIITKQRSGLLSISFVISMYFASNGVIAIMNAFNQTSHSIESRSFFKKHLVAILLVAILAFNMIVSGAALALSSVIVYFFEGEGFIGDSFTWFLLRTGQLIIILVTSLIAFSSLYYFAPAKKRIFPFFSAGSILASFLSVITFRVFSVFIENFSNYNRFYGSLGTMIMLLVWINLTSLMLLIGFELNASIYEAAKNDHHKS